MFLLANKLLYVFTGRFLGSGLSLVFNLVMALELFYFLSRQGLSESNLSQRDVG